MAPAGVEKLEKSLVTTEGGLMGADIKPDRIFLHRFLLSFSFIVSKVISFIILDNGGIWSMALQESWERLQY
jgi:hypothetical protein